LAFANAPVEVIGNDTVRRECRNKNCDKGPVALQDVEPETHAEAMIQLLENEICTLLTLKELEICSGLTMNYPIYELKPFQSRVTYAIHE
jgi:hypothetical protein